MSMERYFKLLFRFKLPDELIGLQTHGPYTLNGNERPELPPPDGFWFTEDYTDLLEKLPEYLSEHGPRTRNVFAGVCPRTRRGHEEADVSRITALWVDIDEYERGMEAVDKFILPPTMLVGSGNGIHAYWMFESGESPDKVTFKTFYTHQWAPFFNADATGNINRVLRVPDTWHNKDPDDPKQCRLLSHDKSAYYKFDDLVAAVQVCSGKGRNKYSSIHRIITDKKAVNDKEFDGDHSARDWKVTVALVDAGMSDEGIAHVFANNACGNKDHDKYWEHYIPLTIENARRATESVSTASGAFSDWKVRDGKGTWKGDKQVATFAFEPQMVVKDDDGDLFFGRLDVFGESYAETLLPVKSFTRSSLLVDEIGRAGAQWLGSDRDCRSYQVYLYHRANELGVRMDVEAVEQTGLYRDAFLSFNQVLTEEGFVDKTEAPVLLKSEDDDLHMPTVWTLPDRDKMEDFVQNLWAVLPQLNRPEVVWPVVGWMAISPYRPILTNQYISFPILNIWGEPGSGKTKTVETVVMRMLGYDRPNNLSAAAKNFAILKKIGASTALCFAMEEYRRSIGYDKGSLLSHYLRLSYDQSFEQKGHWPNVKSYPLTAPAIILGEDPLTEQALLERSVQVNPKKSSVKPGTIHHESYHRLQRLPLESFAGPYLQYVLETRDKIVDMYPMVIERVSDIFDDVYHERVLSNIAVVTMGMELFLAFARRYGVEWQLSDDYLYQTMIGPISQVLGDSFAGENLADEFIISLLEVIDVYEHKGGTPLPFLYKIEEGGARVYFRRKSAFDWFRKAQLRLQKPVFDDRALKTQLEERLGTYLMRGKGRHSRRAGTTVHFHYCIDVPAACEHGLDLPERIYERTENLRV